MVLAVPFPGPAYAAFCSISLPFRILAKPYSFGELDLAQIGTSIFVPITALVNRGLITLLALT